MRQFIEQWAFKWPWSRPGDKPGVTDHSDNGATNESARHCL
jgi:hypothetical protein